MDFHYNKKGKCGNTKHGILIWLRQNLSEFSIGSTTYRNNHLNAFLTTALTHRHTP